MRRSIHSLIVALLCLTLCVDSAKACWWLRHHRSRAQVCRPAACPPASSLPCDRVTVERPVHGEVVVVDQADCACGAVPTEYAVVDHAVEHEAIAPAIEHDVLEDGGRAHATVKPADPGAASVVVHGPTMVLDAAPAQPAPRDPEPTSVVTQPTADKAVAPAAQPMPVAAASPAALPSTTAQEPLPTLKPAIAPQSPVAPASNEQPMPESQAAAPSKPAKAEQANDEDDADAPAAPMPAAVDDLAGGPTMKPPMPKPQEPNLFDLYDDEGDDAIAPAEEPPAEESDDDTPHATASDDTDAPTESNSAEDADASAPADEVEMTEEDADAAETDATDGESEAADADASAEETTADESADESADEADEAPEADPEQAEADPAATALAVPDEPMRRWTNDAGTHHAQGWLVEVRADRVRILKVNGRHTTVLTESLSTADRDYVSAVGARLAAERQGTNPAPTTTAGL